MQSAIIILLPGDHTRADIESALRKHAAAVEIIDLPPAALHTPANDPDELPLWRWFTF
jgi:hypothetical protein